MKKNTIITAVIISIGLMFQSCNNFLDLSPRTAVGDDKAIVNLIGARSAVVGIYSGVKHSTYYGRNFVINGDCPTANYILSPTNSNRFVSESNWLLTKSTGTVADLWNQTYDVINRANYVINAKLTLLSSEQAEADQLFGEAYFFRALAHFDLVRTYAQAYNFTADHSHLGVPYMKENNSNAAPSRDDVKTVYQEILNDLSQAESLVKKNRSGVYTVGPDAVAGLKARVYLYMGDYNNARDYAEKILSQKDKYQLVSNVNYADSWKLESTTESVFTIMTTMDDYFATNSLGYILTSKTNKGYGDLLANSDFVKIFAANDVRSNWFKGEKNGDITDYYVSGKYPGRGVVGLDNFHVIRLSEIYLIAAEAHMKASTIDENKARTYVNAIRQRAIPTAPAITVSGSALVDEILLEKRKELAFEGHYFFDQKRLLQDVLSGSTGKTIAYPNDKFAWPIPESETNANPNIGNQQNPGY